MALSDWWYRLSVVRCISWKEENLLDLQTFRVLMLVLILQPFHKHLHLLVVSLLEYCVIIKKKGNYLALLRWKFIYANVKKNRTSENETDASWPFDVENNGSFLSILSAQKTEIVRTIVYWVFGLRTFTSKESI